MSEGNACLSEDIAWRQYLCKACGYVYDEKAGDPDSGLPPGTRYEDIPDDWYCPICGVTKSDFVLVDAPSCIAARQATAGSIVADRTSASGVNADAAIQVESITHPSFTFPSFANPNAFDRVHGTARHSKPNDVLIVGGGMAGWALVEALRSFSSTLSIAMVSDCEATRYDKPMLSVAFTKKIHLDDLSKESGAEAAERLGVKLYARTTAIQIDHNRRTLRTTRGEIRYRRLVLAYGVRPILPNGLPPQHCWRINHLDHYVRFRKALEAHDRSQRILIVGAGLIGTELTDDLARSSHQVTLVDTGAYPLNQLAKDRSQVEPLLNAWNRLQVRFLPHANVHAVSPKTSGSPVSFEVTLERADPIEVDHVLVCVGQQVEDRLAQSARLNWLNGIEVDPETLQTSQHDIYAMGDCVSVHGRSHRFVEPLRRQAYTIASQIADTDLVRYEHRPVPVRVKTASCPLTL